MPDMENFIKKLKISNFKSIREAELECGRVNLFVGKPNVGKSNVLEALSLLGSSYSGSKKFMSEFIRYKSISNCFYYNNIENDVSVVVNDRSIFASIIFNPTGAGFFEFSSNFNKLNKEEFDFANISSTGEVLRKKISEYSPVKYYLFKQKPVVSALSKHYFLTPPDGRNLSFVVQHIGRLSKEIASLFEEYNLQFVIDILKRQFEIQRKIGNVVHKIDYQLIADTLQRIIFHYAAIFSNKHSIILFEEPEAHSFPPYVRELALKISESTDNQYFITTHSPHLFTTLVEETPIEELAVFITYFENFETKFKKLNAEEISELLNYGIDIFFNQRWFLNEEVSENPA
jgi:AAA15 family ATPase/GTPase